jgi:hypothetical protein
MDLFADLLRAVQAVPLPGPDTGGPGVAAPKAESPLALWPVVLVFIAAGAAAAWYLSRKKK